VTVRKTIDINAAFDFASVTDTQAILTQGNRFTRTIVRGDELLLRWTMQAFANDATAPDLSDVVGLEFVAIQQGAYGARDSADVVLYSSDNQFNPADWPEYDLSAGKFCCRVNTNTTNLSTAIALEDSLVIEAGVYATHAPPTPTPVDSSSSTVSASSTSSANSVSSSSSNSSSSSTDILDASTSSATESSSESSSSAHLGGYLTCLWQGEILIQNDVWRIGERDLVEIIVDPPVALSSSSSSSDSSLSSSSSTLAMTTSS